jgi:hypothetical protein
MIRSSDVRVMMVADLLVELLDHDGHGQGDEDDARVGNERRHGLSTPTPAHHHSSTECEILVLLRLHLISV